SEPHDERHAHRQRQIAVNEDQILFHDRFVRETLNCARTDRPGRGGGAEVNRWPSVADNSWARHAARRLRRSDRDGRAPRRTIRWACAATFRWLKTACTSTPLISRRCPSLPLP